MSPAFLFYYKDFEIDTSAWHPEEVGYWIRLMCYQAKHGHLPKDPEKLAQICRVPYSRYAQFIASLSDTLSDKLSETPCGEYWHIKKLTRVIEENRKATEIKSILAIYGNQIKHRKLGIVDLKKIKRAFKSEHYLGLSDQKRKEKIKEFIDTQLQPSSSLSDTLSVTLKEVDVNANANSNNKEGIDFQKQFIEDAMKTQQWEYAQRTGVKTKEEYQQIINLFLAERATKFAGKEIPLSYFNYALPDLIQKNKATPRSLSVSKGKPAVMGSENYEYN